MPSNKHQTAIESASTFMVKMEDLVKEIVIQSNVPYYRIESRLEPNGTGDGYLPVIRIVTYFEDSVSKIAEIIRTEFDIDSNISVDKKKVRVDSFSYKHIQFSAAMKSSRQNLVEYRRNGNRAFEIQLCSMLQDAWAGIEKELGYDNASFPEELKRDFYRVGALLEMADLEFLKIRSALGAMNVANLGTANFNTPAQPVAAAPAPQPVAEPAQPVIEPAINSMHPEVPAAEQHATPLALPELPVTESAAAAVVLDHMEMNLSNPESLSVHVNSVEENNSSLGVQNIPDLVNGNGAVAEQPVAEAPAANAGGPEAVALNIDKIETFNMNVNGMIERVIEKSADDANKEASDAANGPAPKFERRVAMDENSQMTDAMLREYVSTSNLVKDIDKEIAGIAGATLNAEIDVEGDVERLRFLKVYSLKQLHERLADNKGDIVAFAEKWIGKDNGGSFDSGICLFYLEYLLVGKRNDPAFAVEYVLKYISDNDYSARFIIPTYNAISKTEQAPIASHLTLR